MCPQLQLFVWKLKRKANNATLIAQTSVIWDWKSGIRFEILQIVREDDNSLFKFRDIDFIFDTDIFLNDHKILRKDYR